MTKNLSVNKTTLRCDEKAMDARREPQPRVGPWARFATPQTRFIVTTLRAGVPWDAGAGSPYSRIGSKGLTVVTENALAVDRDCSSATARFIRLGYAAAVLCSAALPLWAADSGTAKIVRGDVRIERAGTSVPLKVGDPVQEKDRIVVPADGSAGITLRDDTRISLGPRSALVINSFSFDSKTQEGNVDTSIFRGTMRYVTGLVGRLSPTSVRVATATATVGIRGTDFIIEVAGGE